MGEQPRSDAQTFDADSTLRHLDRPAMRRFRQASAATAIAIHFVYLAYRGLFTLNPAAPIFSAALYLAEIHGFISLVLYYFQIWNLRAREVPPIRTLPTVDVFITTYNEELPLLRQTVRAAIAMRYPHRTYVCDDGRRPAVRALCQELGCEYLTRPDNVHAKAGNWNNAFRQTSGELIVTFDADHVPRADFLERTIGFFADPKVGLVQVPQRYHNLDSLQHHVSWQARRLYGEQDAFFNLVMPGKDHWNAAFFCGTGAVIRREALAPHGGLIVGTITEDMHTALALQADGWKSIYLNELLVTGLAPMDFTSYTSQRLRWAEGNLAIIRHINPLTCRGLSLAQRLCYFASMFHWTIGWPKLVFYLTPAVVLGTGWIPVANFSPVVYGLFAAHYLSLVASYKLLSRGNGRLLFEELFNMANFFTLIVATKRFVFGKGEGVFVVTSKRGGDGNEAHAVLPQLGVIAVTVMGMLWQWLLVAFGGTDDWLGTGIVSFWGLHNVALAAVVVGFALRPVQKRQVVRFRAGLPVELPGLAADGRLGVAFDIAELGCTLLWPSPLPSGTPLNLRILLGPRAVSCRGEVVSVRRRPNDGPAAGWVPHGVRFVHHDQTTVDTLADGIYNMTVPELFTRLSADPYRERAARLLAKLSTRSVRIRAARREAFLPIRLLSHDGEILAITRELSATGLGILSPAPLEVGSRVRLELHTAEGIWRTDATVSRRRPVPSPRPEFATWHVGLHLGGGAVASELEQLLEPAA